jgi:hypothetical protein
LAIPREGDIKKEPGKMGRAMISQNLENSDNRLSASAETLDALLRAPP